MIPLNLFRHQYSRTRPALVALVFSIIVAALAFSSRDVSSQGGDVQRRDLERVFSRHERLTLDPGQIQRQVKQTRSLTLTTSRGTFEMTLEPHDMRAPGYVAEAWSDKGVRVIETGGVRTYKGTVKGLPAAQARLTIDEETVEGLLITPEELFFLEPTKRFSRTAAKTDFVFYSESDLKVPLGECGTTTAQMVAQHSASASNQASAKGPQPEEIFGPALEIGISLEADFEYFDQFDVESATVANIEGIMNQVEGIYNTQMGLQFNILHTRVWTTDTDPYTSSVPSTLLNQFRTSYNSSAPAPAATRDIAHLFTGRNLDGSTIGIAFLPGLDCSSQANGYGLSEFNGFNQAGLTAHEIGHNLNAVHVTSTQGSDCGNPGGPTTSVMNPSISASTNFCQFSRDQITAHTIEHRSCLTPLTQPGCTYALSETTQNVPSGAGGGSVTITTQPGCNWAAAEGQGWLTITGGATGTGTGTVSYSVTANDGACGPRSALISIGGEILTVTQVGRPNYLTDPATATSIVPGTPVTAALSSADCVTGLNPRPVAFMDRYKFNGMAGQKIRIEMNATVAPPNGVDTYLYLIAPNGSIVNENDDIQLGVETNSRIPCTNIPSAPCNVEFYTLTETGTYIIVATSFSNNETGGYTLTLTSVPLLLTAQVTDSVGTAVALNSVTFARTSNATNTAFRIFDPYNFSADQTTRLILLTSDLGLIQQQNPASSLISVSAGGHPLVVENVGPFTFPGLNGTYIVVALKRIDGGAMPTGSLAFTVTTATLTSNVVTIAIAP